MGIELYWDNDEQTVMLCEFEKNWSWDDLFATFDKIKKVTDKRDDVIGAILDIDHGVNIPGGSIFNIDTRNKAMQMLKMGGSKRGPMVVVGANSFIKAIYHAVGTIDRNAQQDIYFAKTLTEARKIMNQRLSELSMVKIPV